MEPPPPTPTAISDPVHPEVHRTPSHLGLTWRAANQFLIRIGYWKNAWHEPGTYRRPVEDAWITDNFGPPLIAYDAAGAIGKWLRDNGKEGSGRWAAD